MEYCHGFKVTDSDKMEAHKVDREALMRRICQAYAPLSPFPSSSASSCRPRPLLLLKRLALRHPS
jgi:hypothetical protein